MCHLLEEHPIRDHAKDSRIEDRLTIHIDVCSPRTGSLDLRTYLRRMEALNSEYPLIVTVDSSRRAYYTGAVVAEASWQAMMIGLQAGSNRTDW